MNDIFKILDDLSELTQVEHKKNESKTFDLTNDNDYQQLKDSINTLNESPMGNFIASIFGLDKETLDNLLKVVDEYRAKNKKEKEPKFKRPSETISIETGLRIHKLVQEYVDTMIKPYNPKEGGLSNKQVNDAYAGLYEYSCWLYQK